MDFGQQLERYSTLKNELDNYAMNRHEKLSPDNELNNVRKYLLDIYMATRLNAGLDKGNEFDFEAWVDSEIELNNSIQNFRLENNNDLNEPVEQANNTENNELKNNSVIDSITKPPYTKYILIVLAVILLFALRFSITEILITLLVWYVIIKIVIYIIRLFKQPRAK